MPGIGQNNPFQVTGRPTQLSYDNSPQNLAMGVTVGWGAITAVSGSTVVLPDGTNVYVGEKYLAMGQTLVPITTQPVFTIAITGDGGTFGIILTDQYGVAEETTQIAYNATAAQVKAAIQALSNFPEDRFVSVALSSTTYTITLAAAAQTSVFTTDITDLTYTSGAASAVVTNTTSGSAYGGQWVPYNSGGSGGAQTLARGSVGLVNRTVKFAENTVLGVNVNNTTIGVITGGRIWGARALVGGSGQPSNLAALTTVMPELIIADQNF